MEDAENTSKWAVRGKRNVYLSEWVELWLEDVETPSGDRFEHHVIRFPRESVYALVVRSGHVLMMWRHRFITNAWGWEVPAGWVDPGESPEVAVLREVEEETGWRGNVPTLLTSYFAQSGMSDMHFWLFEVNVEKRIGDPKDVSEANKIEWIPIRKLLTIIAEGKVQDGPTLLALTYLLASNGRNKECGEPV